MAVENNPARPVLANIEAEAALLGAMMLEPRTIDQAADRLRIEDFAEPVHSRIFDAIVREHALGGRPTPITLRPLFVDDPAFEQLGGVAYLGQLTGSGAGLVGFRQFIDQILELANRRRLSAVVDDVRDKAGDLDIPLATIVDEADAALVASIERRETSRTVTLGGAMEMAIDRIATIREGDGKIGATTGIDEMDQLLGGFEPGQLVIVAGRPGMGKTAVAVSSAMGLARNGYGVLLVSLEMKAQELGMRALSDLCCRKPGNWIPFDRIVNATTTDAEERTLRAAQTAASQWPFEIEDTSAPTLARLTLAIRRAKRRFAARGQTLNVVMIDYLQLVQPDQRRTSVYEAVSEVSKALKALAKDLDIAIVALAQLSRAVEQREDKRPQLSDLRDSGQIEQDADSVMFLYREEYYLAQSKAKRGCEEELEQARSNAAGRLTLICAKRRNGRVGDASCLYLAPYQAVRSGDWGRM